MDIINWEKELQTLNEPQLQGVINTEGPTMLIAGAGSGKTRVLTYRIAQLMKVHQVDAFNILALTFTNKAAKEMRERIEKVAGSDARNLWMGTFHSVFARILRAEAVKLGYQSDFTIYDTDDAKSLIKTIVKEQNLDDALYKANVVYNRISGAKNRLITWQEYTTDPAFLEDDSQHKRPEMGRIYRIYSERCYKSNAMDFDDLLLNTYKLFHENTDVLNKYQHRFHYVLIDEFQDTNIVQYMIAKKLAAVRQNICVVGDDAQSIYAFRGANIKNILNFKQDYTDLQTIKLEQNYRSTKVIVGAANSIIERNQYQLKKNVWTSNQEGELIEVIRATSDNEEGRLIATSIFETRMKNQAANSDFAILYRTNSQSRAMEEALRRLNIKYRVVGGVSFYQRKEIKDLLAYVRLVINPNDEASMRRIINVPKRGIGPGSVEKILVAADDHGIGIGDVMENATSLVGNRGGQQIADFALLLKSFRLTMERKDAYETASLIAKNSGLLKELYEDKTVEGLNRYENVQELLNAIKEFVDDPEREDKSLGAFLQEVSLLTDEDRNEKDLDAVTLMTIHSSKGLEFPYVFVVGLEEELFPSQMMLSSRDDLEEERRLFYVAVTRAKVKVHLSYALNRYRFGTLKNCEPSRFLSEINPAYVQVSKRSGTQESVASSTWDTMRPNITKPPQKPVNKVNTAAIIHTPSPDFQPSDTSVLTVGMRIEHAKFGFGHVARMEDDGPNKKAIIQFEKAGEKTLLLSFAKLRIVT